MAMANQAEVDAITEDVIEKYQQYVNPTQVALLKVGGFDHVEDSAEGVTITDLDGNTYIDCLGGFGTFSLGHRNPRVVAAVKAQLDKMPLASKTFLNKPLADVAAKLAEIAPGNLQYSFLCNSGTEAVEGALKIARMATGKTDIISTTGGFHGKTMGGLSAGGRDAYKTPFEPLLPGFCQAKWNDVGAIEAVMSNHTAAVIVEPVQGEGGIQVPHADYLPAVRKLCTDRGVLLIVDEVQTGFGRTGKLFAVEHWGVSPDIMTLAKALGGGVMPVGAVMATAEIWDKVFRENPLIHSSTFGGGELACVAALAAIAYFLTGLRRIQDKYPKVIADTRGLGLMLGIEFADADVAKIVIGAMIHRGVVAAYTLNNPKVIRIEPPLIITRSQIDTVLEAVSTGVGEAIALLGDLLE
jgi:putrescine aminotransferase